MALASWTSTQIINQLNSGSRWFGPLITYSFPTSASTISSPFGEAQTFRTLNTNQQYAAKQALATWDDLIAPTIVQVNSLSNIEFGLSTTDTDFAHAYFPSNGSIWFNANSSELLTPQVGQYGFETFIHEIGHALGLEHMGNYNGAGNNQPSAYQDSTVHSVMSYFGPDHNSGQDRVAWADWVGTDGKTYSPQTPMLSDVLAVQSIYGPDLITRLGSTVYGFNSNVIGDQSSIFDFAKNKNPILTIYDAGGTDTLDLSGFGSASTINLNSGSFSSCNAMTNNIAIAYSSLIENAVGGPGNDLITGNALNNLIDGGGGRNTAVYAGVSGQYKVCLEPGGVCVNDTIAGRDGLDTLNNIQLLQFSNQTSTIGYSLGGLGLDTTAFKGAVGQYTIWVGSSGVGVVDKLSNRDNVQVLTQIERASFSDSNIAFDVGVGQSAGESYRLYKAAFDRAPDFQGLGYWINAFDNGASLSAVANAFLASYEFQNMMGPNNSDENFVTTLYNHVLHRAPDQSGYVYWLNALAQGNGRGAVLASFSESPENLQQTLDLVAGGVQYKLWQG